jgi:hypothetical protein
MAKQPIITGVDYASGEDYSVKTVPHNVECGHYGCRHHVTHACEGCGRIAASGIGYVRL